MDELIHHCLREVSFDGDLGCDVSRLRDFVIGFYSTDTSHPQVIDDAFCAFIWSVIVRQPTVRIGTILPGVSEVYVAPQISAKRKALAKGEEHVEEAPPSLDLIPDANFRSLEDLKVRYGDTLRVAVDPQTSFAAITGSHIRPPKLSPMVYTALQFITRGRENGISVVDLGKKTKYDQKTCFYLIKQLVELGLVKKARRGGVGTNFCVHKYFIERSVLWQQIHDEEAEGEQPVVEGGEIFQSGSDAPILEKGVSSSMHFDPIDERHLSSLALVRNRIVKLLKASKNYIHASNNLLLTIGFANPTKTDRRFFQTRLRELVQQGVIERVLVPSTSKRDRNVKCIRLVTPDRDQIMDDSLVIQSQDDDDEKDIMINDVFTDHTEVKANRTIHRQIADLLEDAGPRGLTLNEMSISLGHFDKRTIELLLTRAERDQPPPHLSDLGTAGFMETHGRERRHRYYTVAAYKTLTITENFDGASSTYASVDFLRAGDFASTDINLFYDNEVSLRSYQDFYKDQDKSKEEGKSSSQTKKRKMHDDDPEGADEPIPKAKRGRPRKKPRMDSMTGEVAAQDGAAGGAVTQTSTPAVPQKRGRPKKLPAEASQEPTPKKRGRPPKKKPKVTDGPVPIEIEIGGTVNQETSDLLVSRPLTEPSSHGAIISIEEGDGSMSVAQVPEGVLGESEENAEAQTLGVNAYDDAILSPQKESSMAPSRSVAIGDLPKDVSQGGGEDISTFQVVSFVSPPHSLSKNTLDSNRTVDQQAEAHQTEPGPGSLCVETAQNIEANVSTILCGNQNDKATRAKLNVSHLRRENELLRVIHNLGGIANLHTKEFFEAHMALIEAMCQAAEPTSAPVGTRLDKRTAEMALSNLESRGRVKLLKTFIITQSGVNRPACLVYLPDTPQGNISEFLHTLSRSAPVVHLPVAKKIEEPIDYGSSRSSTQRSALPLQLLQMEEPTEGGKERWSMNVTRAEQLFSYDDDTIRDVLLTERTTLAQLYGFIVGKAMRVRELHLLTLTLFDSVVQSPQLISREHRILHLSHYCQDLSVSVYCSLVSVLDHDVELKQLLESDAGRHTLVKDLPSHLHTSLQVGRSRSRSRILDLLDILSSLGLATPLQASETNHPQFTCGPKGDHPTAFDIASSEEWNISSSMSAPVYWKFNTSAPIHLWALSETFPPFWKAVSTVSQMDGVAYWQELYDVCMNREHAQAIVCPTSGHTGPMNANASLSRSLRRHVSWNSNYVLTWHQKQYITTFMDKTTGQTVTDEASGGSQLQHICRVISAPCHAVQDYISKTRDKEAHELERIKRKSKRQLAEEHAKQNIEAKALLQKKAEEAKLQRERDWETLIQRLHPEPLKGSIGIRMRRLRAQFLQCGTTDLQKWEAEVEAALKEAKIVSRKVLTLPMQTSRLIRPQDILPPPLVSNPPEKSIEFLISQQGPPLSSIKKRKGKIKAHNNMQHGDTEDKTVQRRHRFIWNRDYDELARDASAVIKARCRNGIRLDWAALEQVFPAVPRNSVRQRLVHMRENAGDDAYLKRLEDKWNELWLQHRGTSLLPDEDPRSPSNFDIIKHIEFLRKHVDKNALRVGFVQQETNQVLPASVNLLIRDHEVIENAPFNPSWEFLWNVNVEEGREKYFLRQAFTMLPDESPYIVNPGDDSVQVAEAALKMVFGTSTESYDIDAGARLLHNAGDQAVSLAIPNLLGRGVLSKTVRDINKPKPGRTLKISDINQNAIGGPITRDIFHDASSLEEVLATRLEEWDEWPLLAADGDIASLVQLTSEDKVEFKMDLKQARAARLRLEWNSKKADDDDVETGIYIHFHPQSTDDPLSSVTSSPDILHIDLEGDLDGEHGGSHHGESYQGLVAVCKRKTSQGFVDCAACLEDSLAVTLSRFDADDVHIIRRTRGVVLDAGAQGVTRDQLQSELDAPSDLVTAHIDYLTNASPPLIFWTGYSRPVLSASEFVGSWAVVTSDDPRTLVLPRRWLDVHGHQNGDDWKAALRAVIGIIVFRPGISQTDLRWRLRAVYDRQEVLEVLYHLMRDGAIERRSDPNLQPSKHSYRSDELVALDDGEEQHVFWFVCKNRHWYQSL
ncbi:hypothetical protein SERLA73DRAFT_166216 [Serpula lacrymans var. lacrymans S7.3]|uniref:Uncharacterized protein n=2 Tax=Serpula lacrymans var. lacrymans TaxID=341189 RepID=F8PR28_SERL3|nr:uncharacterized protein SERLADRAFT_446557 [Serpula lacrymans var. lacrymans S7.9]EGO01685.1 hypothetical protein SERLA73DRAFT_166216 [Serpula lacrymans var. lacrymans S7.3]EGO27327.1 hypothetical protein SERLADRAFT_446557 [Serpula lacrymans var. lacrymans S7.9]